MALAVLGAFIFPILFREQKIQIHVIIYVNNINNIFLLVTVSPKVHSLSYFIYLLQPFITFHVTQNTITTLERLC